MHAKACSCQLVEVKPLPRFCVQSGAGRCTWLEGFEGQSPLRRGLRAVVLHDGYTQEARLLEVHGELEVLVPHGVEGVAVDGLGAEVAAVDRHAQDIHLDAGAAGAVAGTHVLAGDNLEQRCDTCDSQILEVCDSLLSDVPGMDSLPLFKSRLKAHLR